MFRCVICHHWTSEMFWRMSFYSITFNFYENLLNVFFAEGGNKDVFWSCVLAVLYFLRYERNSWVLRPRERANDSCCSCHRPLAFWAGLSRLLPPNVLVASANSQPPSRPPTAPAVCFSAALPGSSSSCGRGGDGLPCAAALNTKVNAHACCCAFDTPARTHTHTRTHHPVDSGKAVDTWSSALSDLEEVTERRLRTRRSDPLRQTIRAKWDKSGFKLSGWAWLLTAGVSSFFLACVSHTGSYQSVQQ